MPTLEESVIDFVAENTGIKREKITLSSSLLADFGVDGDDGWGLIKLFGEKYKVDLTGFRYNRHFGPEACGNLILLIWYILSLKFLKKPEHDTTFTPIHISDLIEAARSKKWIL